MNLIIHSSFVIKFKLHRCDTRVSCDSESTYNISKTSEKYSVIVYFIAIGNKIDYRIIRIETFARGRQPLGDILMRECCDAAELPTGHLSPSE